MQRNPNFARSRKGLTRAHFYPIVAGSRVANAGARRPEASVGIWAVAKKTDSGDYYQTLRARFAGKADAALDARFRMPADPTDQFFGADPAAEEPAATRLFDPAGVRTLADGLASRITAQGKAETTLLAYGLRLAVAAFWLTVAGWYVTTTAQGDASALAKLFFIIAGAGAAAAIFGVLLTLATGKASAKRTREQAIILGQRMALETHSLDTAIGQRHPGRQMNAVSAEAFLNSVSFANGETGSPEAFRSYLKRESGPKTAGGAAVFLAALLLCVAIAGALGLGADPSVLPLSDYPLALGAVIGGLGLYAGAGLFAALFGRSWRAHRDGQTETAAFANVQAAFAAAHGVAPKDLSARLRGDANMAKHSLDATSEIESPAAPNPDWRDRDSGPQFVDTGFQATPRAFRTDAFEKKFRP